MADALFDLPIAPLTVADIDEWIAVINGTLNAHAASHLPNEWARVGLGAVLGEEIPDRRWSSSELLGMLRRARRVAAGVAIDRLTRSADPGVPTV